MGWDDRCEKLRREDGLKVKKGKYVGSCATINDPLFSYLSGSSGEASNNIESAVSDPNKARPLGWRGLRSNSKPKAHEPSAVRED